MHGRWPAEDVADRRTFIEQDVRATELPAGEFDAVLFFQHLNWRFFP